MSALANSIKLLQPPCRPSPLYEILRNTFSHSGFPRKDGEMSALVLWRRCCTSMVARTLVSISAQLRRQGDNLIYLAALLGAPESGLSGGRGWKSANLRLTFAF